MNKQTRAHANAREDTTELERVVCELEQVIESIVTERYERIPNMGAAIKEVCTDALKSYAQSVAEEAVREARRSVLEIAKPGTLYQTADPNPTTRSGKANEMVNKEMEEQVEEFMDCWGDYFDGYICCQGFGCSCNGTKTDVEVIKHLTQALHTARTQGLRKGLEKSQELLDEMMEEGRKQGKAEEGEKWSKAVEACSDDKGNLFQNDLLLALSLTNTDVTKLI